MAPRKSCYEQRLSAILVLVVVFCSMAVDCQTTSKIVDPTKIVKNGPTKIVDPVKITTAGHETQKPSTTHNTPPSTRASSASPSPSTFHVMPFSSTVNVSVSTISRFLVSINVSRTIWLILLVAHSIYLPVLVAYLLARRARNLHRQSQVFSEKQREIDLKNAKSLHKPENYVVPESFSGKWSDMSLDSNRRNVGGGSSSGQVFPGKQQQQQQLQPHQQPQQSSDQNQLKYRRPAIQQDSASSFQSEPNAKTIDQYFDATYTNTDSLLAKNNQNNSSIMSGVATDNLKSNILSSSGQQQQDQAGLKLNPSAIASSTASATSSKNLLLIKQKDNVVNFDIDKSIEPFNSSSNDLSKNKQV